jgi:putative colanic acid biosynthesis UDP-glucose lipid carrier transferase
MSDYTRTGSFYPGTGYAAGTPLRAGGYSGQKKSYYLIKRGFDIVLSGVVLVALLSWLVPLIALIIRLDSGGPVFFRQKRVGRGGRHFTCYKFRTMVANEDADSMQAVKNDPRITRAGGWLRRSNIDELPQLFNVLSGEMSLVGPRPHMPADCRRFSGLVSDYDFRHQVKPGITGLAQVKGYHGPTPDYESIFRRYQLDALYIRNAGIWLDIRIMISTVIRRIIL